MRALRTALLVILISLGFLGGDFAGWRAHGDNVVRLTADELDAAAEAGQLHQRIIEELQGRYCREVDPDKLSQKGIDGMLKSLDDPYTAYLSPKEAQLLEEQTEGEYSGIGASLQKKNGGLLITGVFDGSPAKGAGLGPGDVIVAVDGVPLRRAPRGTVGCIADTLGYRTQAAIRLSCRSVNQQSNLRRHLYRRGQSTNLRKIGPVD